MLKVTIIRISFLYTVTSNRTVRFLAHHYQF